MAVWSLKLSRLRYERFASGGTSDNKVIFPAFIIIHFPLLLEDPLATERKSKMIEEIVMGDSGGSAGKDGDGRVACDTKLLLADPSLLHNVYSNRWGEAEKKGVRIKTLVHPEVS